MSTSRSCRYLMDGDAAYPLVLYGPSGSGKTTALSALVQYCHSWNQNAAVVARFANASVYSSSLEQTLNSLTVQLDLVDSGKSNWFKHVRGFLFFIFLTNLLVPWSPRPKLRGRRKPGFNTQAKTFLGCNFFHNLLNIRTILFIIFDRQKKN